jgi:DDE superfamily endonuclease
MRPVSRTRWLHRASGAQPPRHGHLDCSRAVPVSSRSRLAAFAYVDALLAERCDRRSCWQLAEAAGHGTPRRMQALLAEHASDWKDALGSLQRLILDHLGDPEAILVLDETAELKKGTMTVGVARQHAGITGQVENCQTLVNCAYVTGRGPAPLTPRAEPSPASPGTQPADWADTGALPASADEQPPAEIGMIKVSVPEARRLLRLATTPMAAAARQLGYTWSAWRRKHQARARFHHYQTRLRASPGINHDHVTNRDCNTGPDPDLLCSVHYRLRLSRSARWPSILRASSVLPTSVFR